MRNDPLALAESELRETGLALPEAHEAFPWGHRALKVRGKAFAFLALEEDGLSVSVELPLSAAAALERLGEWLRESYRAVAPRRLAARVADPTA